MTQHISVRGTDNMLALGRNWSSQLTSGMVVFFQGDLGTGKTTIVQGLLDGLGYSGRVKSPTYTLVEPYNLSPFSLYHFDLYRLESPEELEMLGIREFFNPNSVCLIEWPDKGLGFLPNSDVEITIEYSQDNLEARLISNSANWPTKMETTI